MSRPAVILALLLVAPSPHPAVAPPALHTQARTAVHVDPAVPALALLPPGTAIARRLPPSTGARLPLTATHARWLWPTGGAQVVLRAYSAPLTRYAAGHRGIDLATNGEVRAPADGVVHFAGVVVDRPVVSVMHADGYLSSYEPVVTSLRRGDTVTRGQVIGEVRSDNAHNLTQSAATAGSPETTLEPAATQSAAATQAPATTESAASTQVPAPADQIDKWHCEQPCLHFGVRLHGEYVSPLVLLGGIPRSVLLPTRRSS